MTRKGPGPDHAVGVDGPGGLWSGDGLPGVTPLRLFSFSWGVFYFSREF